MNKLLTAALALTLSACMSGGSNRLPEIPEVEFTARLSEFDGETVNFTLPFPEATYTFSNAEPVSQAERQAVIDGHVARSWISVEPGADTTSLSYILVTWDPDRVEDYLTLGWWMLHDDNPEIFNLSEALEFLAFVDGPEFNPDTPPELPADGTATYSGQSIGLFSYETDSETMVTDFTGQAVFSVDFATMMLEGQVSGFKPEPAHAEVLQTLTSENASDPTGYTVMFEATAINPDGTYQSQALLIEHPEKNLSDITGFHGGQFSNIPNDQGNPRTLAGLYGVSFNEPGQGEGRFSGTILTSE